MDLDTIMLLYANLVELLSMLFCVTSNDENLANAKKQLIMIKADTLEIIKKKINE